MYWEAEIERLECGLGYDEICLLAAVTRDDHLMNWWLKYRGKLTHSEAGWSRFARHMIMALAHQPSSCKLFVAGEVMRWECKNSDTSLRERL